MTMGTHPVRMWEHGHFVFTGSGKNSLFDNRIPHPLLKKRLTAFAVGLLLSYDTGAAFLVK
ncbi:MAG: hypothetical protein IJN67_06070 [Oscillospiraceae bacterium]|nr:hypothetical protein [Oscillospiraceae bacterium]